MVTNFQKISKFVLAILCNLLFVAFLILAWHKNITADETVKFPDVALIAMLVYNWRFTITILILSLMVWLLLINLCCCCICYEYLFNKKYIKKTLILLYKLNWSQYDWKFIRNKYYIYLFDSIRYFIYLVSVLVIFLVELLRLKSDANLLTIYMMNLLLYGFNVAIEIYRFVQVIRDKITISNIFPSRVKYSDKLKTWISEKQMNSLECAYLNDCFLLDTEHRAFAHPKELFKIKFKRVKYDTWGDNLVIGFHQTSVKAAESILRSAFRPSTSGMLGPGIYFANNYDVTDHKRNSSEGGAIFCALIDMGRVYEMERSFNSHNYSSVYNSKYLHHSRGKTYDEFIIYKESQILQYTLIVENETINEFRRIHAKTCCCFNCVCCDNV